MHDTDLIGSVEAAAILSVDPATVARWVGKKRLTPVAKAPGRYGAFLFSRAQVQRLARDRLTRHAPLTATAQGGAAST